MDEQVGLAVLDQVDDQLAEQGVLPGEPGAGVVFSVILVERLVHETRAGVGGEQLAHAPGDLLVVVGGEGLHHDAHGPDEVIGGVGATDAFSCLTLEEAGIVIAPDKAARIAVDGIIHRHITQVAHRQQAGHVGVIGQYAATPTVHLIGVDLAILGMVHDGILVQASSTS